MSIRYLTHSLAVRCFEHCGMEERDQMPLELFTSLVRTKGLYFLTNEDKEVSYFPPVIPKLSLITQEVLAANIPSEIINLRDVYTIPSHQFSDVQMYVFITYIFLYIFIYFYKR